MRSAWLGMVLLMVACGSAEDAGSGGAGGSGNGGSAQGGSAGSANGGSGGAACAGWCAYTDGQCGAGVACFCQTNVPGSCPAIPSGQVCGCDGLVYNTQCEAARAGTDITLGEWTCEIPAGTVACGPKRCGSAQACNINYTDRPEPSSYGCLELPESCRSCDCAALDEGCTCEADANGTLIVTCRY